MLRKLTGDKPKITVPAGAVDTQTHVYMDGFPSAPGGIDLPLGDAGPEAYSKMLGWLGLERTVITQANAHMFDNANLLAALAWFGDRARGVAVITGETGPRELQRLHDAGVRGARIMDFPGGAMPLKRLAEVMHMAADMDWVLAVQFDGSEILDHMDLLRAIPGRYFIDHHGKFQSPVSSESPQVDAVLSLIEAGNCWFKLAGCYQTHHSDLPYCAQATDISRRVVASAADRVIWGTNWPHGDALRTEDYPDDAFLLGLLAGWAPKKECQHKILVQNPVGLFDF
jgi:D-galactarolactone isomerase